MAPDKRGTPDELHFDVCIDYKEHSDGKVMGKAFRQVRPGIDVLFLENVAADYGCCDAAKMNAFTAPPCAA